MDDPDTHREEAAIYAIVAIAAAPVVIGTLLTGPIGGGATLCMAFVCIALAGLVRRRPDPVPRVRLVVPGRRFRRTRGSTVVSTRS